MSEKAVRKRTNAGSGNFKLIIVHFSTFDPRAEIGLGFALCPDFMAALPFHCSKEEDVLVFPPRSLGALCAFSNSPFFPGPKFFTLVVRRCRPLWLHLVADLDTKKCILWLGPSQISIELQACTLKNRGENRATLHVLHLYPDSVKMTGFHISIRFCFFLANKNCKITKFVQFRSVDDLVGNWRECKDDPGELTPKLIITSLRTLLHSPSSVKSFACLVKTRGGRRTFAFTDSCDESQMSSGQELEIGAHFSARHVEKFNSTINITIRGLNEDWWYDLIIAGGLKLVQLRLAL